MLRVFVFILDVKVSNLTNGVFVVNNVKLIEYLSMYSPKVGAYLS
jgi:hypothetical protein